eukprot:1139125-Pelagomonas_calceolata.AAC.11
MASSTGRSQLATLPGLAGCVHGKKCVICVMLARCWHVAEGGRRYTWDKTFNHIHISSQDADLLSGLAGCVHGTRWHITSLRPTLDSRQAEKHNAMQAIFFNRCSTSEAPHWSVYLHFRVFTALHCIEIDSDRQSAIASIPSVQQPTCWSTYLPHSASLPIGVGEKKHDNKHAPASSRREHLSWTRPTTKNASNVRHSPHPTPALWH